MNAVLADLNNRWTALPSRTRTLAIAGTAVITVALLYSALWRPLQKDLQRLRAGVPAEAQQLAWMRAQEPAAKALRAKALAISGKLIPTLEQTAVTQGVRPYINRIDAEGNNAARVTLDAVPFNTLISWLSELQSAHGAVVDDATIESRPASGIVNARVRLRTGGA